ncbi:cytochrome c oxidase subunit 6C [Echeneis naucrates]|uniref:Cytochrome c oxidase subunit 6C-1 n=1 Tax=Echeneis naucrates TaxID=173247 RepID=A0A665U939_ECHNA|nr:cytochrome c oxidase subunit 6C-1 [Echeneis naucrates]XP_029357519.1 cytochrome c oxidase subunit 6C-1 [Echeneis naucrates]
MSLPKPVMRGMLAKRLRIHLPLAFAFAFGCAFAYKYAVAEPRKRAYTEFYKQYDAVKEFDAMRAAGIFESVRPSGE